MMTLARIGALALLAGLATQARAERRAPAAVETRATAPVLFALVAPLRRRGAHGDDARDGDARSGGVVFARTMPMFDRHLTRAEKAAPLAPELDDAILRIEPIYDPTRLEGPASPPTMTVGAGTAAMNNVFADRWRLADPDANVARLAPTLALAWQAQGTLPCAAFAKRRLVGPDEVVATALTKVECAVLLATQARGFAPDAPVPVAMAPSATVPVFAAPLPGSRMSSADFWAAQAARVAAIQRRLPGSWPTKGTGPTKGPWPVGKGRAAEGRGKGRPARDARRRDPGRTVAKLGARQEPVAAATDP